MSGNQSGRITVPALNINETIKPILEEIIGLSREVEKINYLNPLAPKRLSELSRSKKNMRQRYYDQLDYCYNILGKPVSGPGFAMSFSQEWSTAKGLSAILKLQDAWRDLESTLDRKTSLTVAMLAIYISVLSLAVSVGPLVLRRIVDP
jgi:hypothetical protein